MKTFVEFPSGCALHLKDEILVVQLCRADGTVLLQQALPPETGVMTAFSYDPFIAKVSDEDETFIAFAKACGAKDDDIDLVNKKFKVTVKLPDGKKLETGWATDE